MDLCVLWVLYPQPKVALRKKKPRSEEGSSWDECPVVFHVCLDVRTGARLSLLSTVAPALAQGLLKWYSVGFCLRMNGCLDYEYLS